MMVHCFHALCDRRWPLTAYIAPAISLFHCSLYYCTSMSPSQRSVCDCNKRILYCIVLLFILSELYLPRANNNNANNHTSDNTTTVGLLLVIVIIVVLLLLLLSSCRWRWSVSVVILSCTFRCRSLNCRASSWLVFLLGWISELGRWSLASWQRCVSWYQPQHPHQRQT